MLIVRVPAGSTCSEGDGLPPGLFVTARAEWETIRAWALAAGACPHERDLSSGAHGCILGDDLCDLVRRATILRTAPSAELVDFVTEIGDTDTLELIREEVAVWSAAREPSSSGSSPCDGAEECASCFRPSPAPVDDMCHCCSAPLCPKCARPTDQLELEEWLFVPNTCDECKALLCRECATVCYACANRGEETQTLCSGCTPHRKVACEYHTWYACSAHWELGCETCAANRNYCAKMEG